MQQQNYEEYWKLTLEYTDFNDKKFLTTLQMIVDRIDELNKNGSYTYNKKDYHKLRDEILKKIPKTSKDIKNQEASTRKAMNQCVKLGFVNPEFQSYHPNTKDYLSSKSSRLKPYTLSSRTSRHKCQNLPKSMSLPTLEKTKKYVW